MCPLVNKLKKDFEELKLDISNHPSPPRHCADAAEDAEGDVIAATVEEEQQQQEENEEDQNDAAATTEPNGGPNATQLPSSPHPTEHHPNPHHPPHQLETEAVQPTKDLEMLVLMDSNNHFIDWNRFFSFVRGAKNCTFCGSLYDVQKIVTENRTTRKIDYVVLSIGVNDLDTKSAEEVLEQLKIVVELMRNKHDQPKIIIGEATPRRDDRDYEVVKYNNIMNDYVNEHEFLFLAKQSKLRTDDGRHYYDEKHITQYAIPIFVASLKRAMRAAYGLNPQGERNDNRRGANFRGFDGEDRGRGNNQLRGGGRGRGGRGGRGRGGFRHNDIRQGGMPGEAFDYRGEFEKFKTEMRRLMADIIPVGHNS